MMIRGKREKQIRFLMIFGVALLSIKRLIANYTIDVEYAVAMSYRMAMGDQLLTQMWEPHQTAALFLAPFIKLWMVLVGSTTGIVLFLNIISLIIKWGVETFLYCTLRKYCNSKILFCICIFFMAVNAKHCLILDFSNLQIYFTILLFCSFVRYLENQKKKRWLLAAALFLCLVILSYPSCVLLYFLAVFVLLKYSEKKRLDFILFTGVCVGIGAICLFCIGLRVGVTGTIENMYWIVTGDATHSQTLGMKLARYGENITKLGLVYGVLAFLGTVMAQIVWLLRKRNADSRKFVAPLHFYIKGFFCVLLGYSLINVLLVRFEFQFAEMYLPIMALGIFFLPCCSEESRKIVKMGLLFSGGNFLSTIMLTNNNLYCVLPYFILGVMVAFIPIMESMGSKEKWVFLFIGLTILKGIYVMMPISTEFCSIFEAGGIIKSGPAVGIVSDYMGAYIRNTEKEFWEQYIEPGDNVLIVAENQISSIQYLYEDVNISVDSTISTPTISEKLLEYWERNPDKFPDVVVVDCWFGDMKIKEDSWIMWWLENEFGNQNYVDGKYQRYYFSGNRQNNFS